MIASLLFTWLQGADFYRNLHHQAVELLPVGSGKNWLDVGTGPGLVARLATERGYQTLGLDFDPAMVQAARRIAKWQNLPVNFQQGDVFHLPEETADVVSAASLLAVLPEKINALASLWRAVRPQGSLLIIEPTEKMTAENANQAIRNGLPRKRLQGLNMWAAARQGNTVNPAIYETLPAASIQFTPLLYGLVGAWVISKK